MAPIIGGVVGAVIVLVILVIVIVVVVVCTIKRRSLTKSVDLNDDVAHCNINPSYDAVHSEAHTAPSCTDNLAYGAQ